MKKLILLSLFLLIPNAHAAIFDAADYLQPEHQAAGIFGEALLSDPTSQGVEGRYRMGISDGFNAAGIIGVGSENRKFRLGAEAVYNLIPDIDRQLGVSGLATAMILRRQNYTSLQLRIAPMLSKTIAGIDTNPANVYFAVPLYYEIHSGGTNAGSQIVLGANWDITDAHDWYMVTEGGAQLSHSESYILLGFGLRFGTNESPFKKNKKANSTPDKEYRSEDFQKK